MLPLMRSLYVLLQAMVLWSFRTQHQIRHYLSSLNLLCIGVKIYFDAVSTAAREEAGVVTSKVAERVCIRGQMCGADVSDQSCFACTLQCGL